MTTYSHLKQKYLYAVICYQRPCMESDFKVQRRNELPLLRIGLKRNVLQYVYLV